MHNPPHDADQRHPETIQKQTPVLFTGKAGEYFGIWIVNLLLTVLTLGIYSAWAKVRTKKYFSNNTQIAGVGFDYHAKPLSILKGRVIAVGLYIAYAIVSKISPVVAGILIVGLFIVTPWVILQATRFNLANTSHRGLRFRFSGTLGEAIRIYLLLPLLIVFTLGLIWPYINFRSNAFRIKQARFGSAPFFCGFRPGEFYKVYLVLAGVMFLFAATLFMVLELGEFADYFGLDAAVFYALLSVVAYSTLLVPLGFIHARIGKLVYNTTTLAQFSFQNTYRARDLIWIYASNMAAVILSFGLLFPWAKIRLMRYTTSHIMILGEPDFDHFAAGQASRVSAVNEGIADIFDIEVAGIT